MAELIKITREEDAPKVVCPHCKAIIEMDITKFKNRVSEIMKSNCPTCAGEIYIGVLILCHPSLQGIAGSISAVMGVLSGHHTILGGKQTS